MLNKEIACAISLLFYNNVTLLFLDNNFSLYLRVISKYRL